VRVAMGIVLTLTLALVSAGCNPRTKRDARQPLAAQGPSVTRVSANPWEASLDAAATRLLERLGRWSSPAQAACRRQLVAESPEAAERAFERAIMSGNPAAAERVAQSWQEAFGETALLDALAAYRRNPDAARKLLGTLTTARTLVYDRLPREAAAMLSRAAADAAPLWADEAALLADQARCLAEATDAPVQPQEPRPVSTRLGAARRNALKLIHAYRQAASDAERTELIGQLVAEAGAVRAVRLAADLESFLPVGSTLVCGAGAIQWYSYLAHGCLDAGMPELALRYAGQWQAQADAAADATMQNEVRRVLSAVHMTLGQNDIALHHAMAAVEQADGLCAKNRADAAGQLGCVLALQGRHEQAAAVFLHGLDWGGDALTPVERADMLLNAATELIRSGQGDKARDLVDRVRIDPHQSGATQRLMRRDALDLVLRCIRGETDRAADEARQLLAAAEQQGDWRFVEQYAMLPKKAALAAQTARQHTLAEKPERYGADKPREILKEMFSEGGQ